MSATENGYMEYRPTLAQRFWRALGYGRSWNEGLFEWRSADPEPGDWWKPGTITTRVVTHLGWSDRLRLLVSGRCEVESFTRTNVIVERAETRSVFAVISPGE